MQEQGQNTKTSRQAIKQNAMIDGVKSSALIEKIENDSIAIVDRQSDIVQDSQKCGFGGIGNSVSRLNGDKKRLGFQMRDQLFSDDTFKKVWRGKKEGTQVYNQRANQGQGLVFSIME